MVFIPYSRSIMFFGEALKWFDLSETYSMSLTWITVWTVNNSRSPSSTTVSALGMIAGS